MPGKFKISDMQFFERGIVRIVSGLAWQFRRDRPENPIPPTVSDPKGFLRHQTRFFYYMRQLFFFNKMSKEFPYPL